MVAVQQAEKLKDEPRKLEAEARTQKEKLRHAEYQASEAEKKPEMPRESIEALRKELQELRTMRVSKRSLLEKAIMSAVTAAIGIVLFLFMKLSLKQFEKLITKKDRKREPEATLRMKTLSKLLN